MEMFELKYFSAVAETENIHTASLRLNVSASALSKAISRLEDELKVNLFEKIGRNIVLSAEGEKLHGQCKKYFELEAETRSIISGAEAEIEIRLAGPEGLLSHFGVETVMRLKEAFPRASFKFLTMTESEAVEAVDNRMADLCFVSDHLPRSVTLKYRPQGKLSFATYAGKKHPLFRRKDKISVKELIEHDFLVLAEDLYGNFHAASVDGWKDDKFPRKIQYKNAGLKILEGLVDKGVAVAYLPTCLGDSLQLKKLDIADCPYSCEQKVMLAGKEAWLKRVGL
jgi:DNA-binding transcriptional LysR family regulator